LPTAELLKPLVTAITSLICSCHLHPGTDLTAHADARQPLVLIVEDDLGTRVLYRDYLSHSGFRTADAHNGNQALHKARELRPDAVLTDLAVPGIDGFELCRALQQSVDTRAIPILAVTGHSEYLEQPSRFRQAGIAQVLVKPCDPSVIVTELRRLLDITAIL
jgi:two-component system, cell cycle response regulator DivK